MPDRLDTHGWLDDCFDSLSCWISRTWPFSLSVAFLEIRVQTCAFSFPKPMRAWHRTSANNLNVQRKPHWSTSHAVCLGSGHVRGRKKIRAFDQMLGKRGNIEDSCIHPCCAQVGNERLCAFRRSRRLVAHFGGWTHAVEAVVPMQRARTQLHRSSAGILTRRETTTEAMPWSAPAAFDRRRYSSTGQSRGDAQTEHSGSRWMCRQIVVNRDCPNPDGVLGATNR